MADKPNKKRGHHPTFATIDGRVITGLHQASADGRFYARVGKGKKWFGKDPARALVDFLDWQAQQTHTSKFTVKLPKGVKAVIVERPPTDAEWLWIGKCIRKDPMLAAEKTGLPLDRLHMFKAPAETMTLAKLAALYWNKPKAPTEKTLRDMRQYWDEFCTLIGGETKQIGDVSVDDINAYHDKIHKDAAKKSYAYVKARFVTVKTIFRYALKRGKDVDAVKQVLTYCEMLVPPKSNGSNPKPISREHFEACYNAADTKWKAILMLALNMAGYPVDVATLKKEDIDLKAGTLCNRRTKTGVPRIAMLWGRTIQAIQAYQQAEPHDSDYLFLSRENGPYNPNHIGRNFRRIRKNAKLPDGKELPETVEFAHIRDGAQTAAIQGGADPVHTDFLLGHKTGIRDDYLLRRPEMVKDACQAIERAYFQ